VRLCAASTRPCPGDVDADPMSPNMAVILPARPGSRRLARERGFRMTAIDNLA
jgi:hypothetical protein